MYISSLCRNLFIVLFFFLVPAYVIHFYIRLDPRIIFLASILGMLSLIFLFKLKTNLKQDKLLQFVCIFTVATGAIGSLVSGSISQIMITLMFSLSIVVVSALWPFVVTRKGLRLINYIAVVILILGLIGFFYHLLGGTPTGEVLLYGDFSRESQIYLTSVGYDKGTFLRIGSIFDEPGALSFFITLVVCINTMFQFSNQLSITLIILGLLSTSYAHFITTVIYFIMIEIPRLKSRTKAKDILLYLLIAVSFLVILNVIDLQHFYQANYGSRLEVSRPARLDGMFVVLETLDAELFFKGGSAIGIDFGRDYGVEVSGNPLTPLFGYGVFIWIIFLFFELFLLKVVFVSTQQELRFAALTIFLVQLQRPYLLNFYWTVPIIFVAYTIYRLSKVKKQNLFDHYLKG